LVFWFFYSLQGLHVREGRVVDFNVVANKTVEIVDVERTEELKRQALSGLVPEYQVDVNVNRDLKRE
jgi:hypothetical protein